MKCMSDFELCCVDGDDGKRNDEHEKVDASGDSFILQFIRIVDCVR